MSVLLARLESVFEGVEANLFVLKVVVAGARVLLKAFR